MSPLSKLEGCFPDLFLPVCMSEGRGLAFYIWTRAVLSLTLYTWPWEEAGMNMRNIPTLSWKSFIRVNLKCLAIANKPKAVKCWP